MFKWVLNTPLTADSTLREKCPHTEFFLVHIFPYSVRMWENTDQKKLHIWTVFTQCWIYKIQKNVNCMKNVQIRTRKNSIFGHFSHSHWNKGNQCLMRRYYVHRWKCKAITCIWKIKFELTFEISSNSLSRSFFKDGRMGMGIMTIVIRCANWYH